RGGSGLFWDGDLEIGQATQVQPGTAGGPHQPHQDLAAARAAGHQAGGVVEPPQLGHRPFSPTVRAAPDGGGDLDPEDVMEGAGEGGAVAPGVRAGHRCLRGSVAPESLLLPGVAVVVVPETFPEAWLVLVPQLDPAEPLAALPRI